MESVQSLLPLLIWVLVIIAIVNKSRKQKQQAKKKTDARPETKERTPASETRKASGSATASAAPPERTMSAERPAAPVTPLRPTVADQDFYTGSLGVFSTEGEDPCHEEQVSLLDEAESMPEPVVNTPQGNSPVPQNGNDLVRAVVMSEILKRPGRKISCRN